MMRSALNRLEAHSETTVMVGDRMDTDIISGLEAGLRTVLVSTGSTRPEQVEHFPYRPTRVVDSIADLVPARRRAVRGRPSEQRDPVLHLAEAGALGRRRSTGEYRWSTLGRTLEEEGFIHCSTPEQVARGAGRYYAGVRRDLVLLTVDPERLPAPLRWEVVNTATGERFRTSTARSRRMP